MSQLNNIAIEIGKFGARTLKSNTGYAIFLLSSMFIICGSYIMLNMTVATIYALLATVFMVFSYRINKKYN